MNFKNVSLLCLLLSVLFSAVLVLFFVLDHQQLSKQIDLTNTQMENSTENWNQINEKKLALQQDLKLLNEQLRDAEMTLEESNARINELKDEISTLQDEISAMKKQLVPDDNE